MGDKRKTVSCYWWGWRGWWRRPVWCSHVNHPWPWSEIGVGPLSIVWWRK